MKFRMEQLDEKQAYKLLAGSVIPRPIAWVTTVDSEGVVNAAPYSFFTVLASEPPLVGFAVSNKRASGDKKDTLANAEATGEFVVNIVPVELAQEMHQTAADYAPGVSETEQVGIKTEPSSSVSAPRIADSPVQFECRLKQVVSFDANYALVVGQVKVVHVSDDVFDNERGYILSDRLNPLGRLMGDAYTTLGPRFELTRE